MFQYLSNAIYRHSPNIGLGKIHRMLRPKCRSTSEHPHAKYRGADKPLARPGREKATTTEDFDFQYILFLIIIGGILVLYI
jgi:hypothetical protein